MVRELVTKCKKILVEKMMVVKKKKKVEGELLKIS